jgi:hypothetical protein
MTLGSTRKNQILMKYASVFHKHVDLIGDIDPGLFIKDSPVTVYVYQENKSTYIKKKTGMNLKNLDVARNYEITFDEIHKFIGHIRFGIFHDK